MSAPTILRGFILHLLLYLTLGCLRIHAAPSSPSGPVKIFLLAGGANMQGKGLVEKDPAATPLPGSLRHMVTANKEEHKSLLNPRGEWVVRDDAWIWSRQGNSPPPAADQISMGELGVGFGATSDKIGPEFGFGHALADHFQETIVIIKTAWGDSSLYQDFRPPTAVSKRGGSVGPCFTRMIESYKEAREEIPKKFPGREIQLAGFGWHQGAADRVTDLRANEYGANLDDLIQDVRSALGSPKLPVVIASSSMGNDWALSTPEGANATAIENAQLALDGQPNITVVYTRPLFYPPDRSPENDPTHWNQNGESIFFIGSYMGRKMAQLCSPVQSPPPAPAPPAPPSAPATPPKVATTPTPATPQPSSSSSAKALAYEPFDYPVGGLDGCNGGFGFDGAWAAEGTTKVATGSLHYSSLPYAGNSIGDLSPGKSRLAGSRKISAKALADHRLLADGSILWFSVLIGHGPAAINVDTSLAFALGNNSFNKGAQAHFIDDEGPLPGSALGFTMGNSGRMAVNHFRDKSRGTNFWEGVVFGRKSTSTCPRPNQFSFIVGKFTWGAESDKLEIYAPGPGLELPSFPLSFLTVSVDQTTFDTLSWTRAESVVMDEIRFGPTYESVGGSPRK